MLGKLGIPWGNDHAVRRAAGRPRHSPLSRNRKRRPPVRSEAYFEAGAGAVSVARRMLQTWSAVFGTYLKCELHNPHSDSRQGAAGAGETAPLPLLQRPPLRIEAECCTGPHGTFQISNVVVQRFSAISLHVGALQKVITCLLQSMASECRSLEGQPDARTRATHPSARVAAMLGKLVVADRQVGEQLCLLTSKLRRVGHLFRVKAPPEHERTTRRCRFHALRR